jgi:hypothetical protein
MKCEREVTCWGNVNVSYGLSQRASWYQHSSLLAIKIKSVQQRRTVDIFPQSENKRTNS